MLHWLSFADPKRPSGEQFLGVAIIEAPDFLTAVLLSHSLGANPGGEVMGAAYPDGFPLPPDRYRGRLLSLDELQELGPMMRGDGSPL